MVLDSKKDIYLINPPTTAMDAEVFFPMALVVLSTYLKNNGYTVEIIDFDLMIKKDLSLYKWDNFIKHAIKHIVRLKPALVGISTICSNYPISIILAKEIKKTLPDTKIILGGHQASAVYKETMEKFPWIDAIGIGEGEQTLLEILQYENNLKNWNKISGLIYRHNNEIHQTAPRTLFEDLGKLPSPDFSQINILDYVNPRQEPAFIEAGRGCPFVCSFCSTAIMWNRKYRAKPPKQILEEMTYLKKTYNLENCYALTHDNFTTYRPYVLEFCKYFKENNTQHLTWSVSARPDTLNESLLEEMYLAGCRSLFFGVDTGSQRMQKIIHKNLKIDHYLEMLKKSTKLGIASTCSFIVGYPDETEEDLNQTLYLALVSKLMGATQIQLHHLSPLASTPLYEENKMKMFYNTQSSTDISMESLENEETRDLIKNYSNLFSSFYTIPTPHIKNIHISDLAIFYYSIINYFGELLAKTLEKSPLTPLELFKLWSQWNHQNSPEYRINWKIPLNTFESFLLSKTISQSPSKGTFSYLAREVL